MAARMESLDAIIGYSLPQVRVLSKHKYDSIWAQREHSSLGMEMLQVLSGHLDLQYRGQTFPADPGDVVLVPSLVPHRDVFDADTGLEVLYIRFFWSAEAIFSRLVDNRLLRRMARQRKAELANMFECLLQDCGLTGNIEGLLQRSRIHTILLFMLREACGAQIEKTSLSLGDQRRQALLESVRQYIRTNYASSICIQDLASNLGVSASYLSHAFRRDNNVSIAGFIGAVRIEHACQLLLEGKQNISQIAYAVGYNAPNYFARAFRKHTGCSPSEYIVACGAAR